MRRGRGATAGLGVTLAAILAGGLLVHPVAQSQTHQHGAPAPSGAAAPKPRTISPDEVHRHGGVPPGWKFMLPAGDAARGRQLFAELECFKCHTVKGESFPAAGDGKNVGPELTGMGAHHPAEYFAESILAPNAVILEGPGYTGPDGSSIMPSYADSLSLTQWLDLVAYLKSLSAPDAEGHAQGDHGRSGAAGMEREQAVGDYRIRLVYQPTGAPSTADHAHHGGSAHDQHAGHHGAGTQSGGHLMAFVIDTVTGQPVPYLPVTATVVAAGAPARTLKLVPTVGGPGFHYGIDVRLPAKTQKIRLSIGRTTMRVMGPAKDRFRKMVTAEFDWTAAPR